jgi:hypothetical protein
MPGFTKRFEATTPLAAWRIQAQEAEGCKLVHRDYVPNPKGNDIGNEEVNLLSLISLDLGSLAVMGSVDLITAAVGLEIGGWPHLHPPEALARVEDEIVVLVVSIGLGYAKA